MILLNFLKGGKFMEKYVPFEKLSKKKQRELCNARRGNWGSIKPVTRMPENSKAYNRKKAQNWKRECSPDSVPYSFSAPVA